MIDNQSFILSFALLKLSKHVFYGLEYFFLLTKRDLVKCIILIKNCFILQYLRCTPTFPYIS